MVWWKKILIKRMERPLVGGSTGHVDDGEIGRRLSRLFGDLPNRRSCKQINIRTKTRYGSFLPFNKVTALSPDAAKAGS